MSCVGCRTASDGSADEKGPALSRSRRVCGPIALFGLSAQRATSVTQLARNRDCRVRADGVWNFLIRRVVRNHLVCTSGCRRPPRSRSPKFPLGFVPRMEPQFSGHLLAGSGDVSTSCRARYAERRHMEQRNEESRGIVGRLSRTFSGVSRELFLRAPFDDALQSPFTESRRTWTSAAIIELRPFCG
jgi:hypothetical protein